MVDIIEDGSNIILRGDNYNLKIDTNRIIYVKPKKSSIYKSINNEVPYGLDRDAKKRFLVELYQKLEYRLKIEKEQEEQQAGQQSGQET